MLGDLTVAISSWDDNYVEITDRSGNTIFLKYADASLLKTMLQQLETQKVRVVNSPLEEVRQ